jgi:hypothetical protein
MSSVQQAIEDGMTVREMIENGISQKEAELRMCRRVFGEDVRFDSRGRPIEQGKGSLVQPTEQSFAALLKNEGSAAEAAARARAAKYKGA